ncbi:MAG: ABC transporter permease [Candidatus Acidiferrales bacterium]
MPALRKGTMQSLLQDVRYAVRTLGKAPVFTLTAVAALAIGIGATSAVFSVVNGVVLRPFAFAEPERLVVVWEYIPSHPLKYMFSSPPDFADWRTETNALESVAAFRPVDLNRTDGEQPERVQGASVTGNLFATLGVAPQIGRALREEDDQPGAAGAAVLSFGYWQANFGGAADVLGRSLTLNGEPFEVVGVMPRDFKFPVPFGLARSVPAPPAEIWTPFRMNYAAGQRGAHMLFTIGRLRDGVSRAQAEAAMMALGARIAEKEPSHAERSIRVMGLQDQVVSEVERAVYILFGAVGLVLLIACANVANLHLARSTARAREISLRAALGAGRTRLVRMLLVESVLLSLAGGAAGLVLAEALVRVVVSLGPRTIPRLAEVALDLPVALFAFGVAVAVGVLFGLAPAMQASRTSFVDTLKEGGRTGSAASGARLRQALVTAEVALSLVLLVSAGLLLKGFAHLQQMSFGFDKSQVLTVGISLPTRIYSAPEQRAQFFENLLAGVSARPEVEAAGAAMALPLATNPQGTGLEIVSQPASEEELSIAFGLITPGYHAAMKIPIVRGRDFTASDRAGQTSVVMVNEEFARQFLGAADAVGQRIRIGNAGDQVLEIVGVAANVRHGVAEFAGVRPMVWRPYAQASWGLPMSVVVRSRTQDPNALIAVVREQVARLDAGLPVYDRRTMETVFSAAVAQPRFSITVLGLFAAIALALAALGVYGVLAYSVSRRRQEMAIRVALGAQRVDVLRLVLGQGMKMTLAGAAIGTAGALAVTRLLESQLYGVSAFDPLTFVVTPLVLSGVALLACYLPARRASRVDPIVALRHE